MTRTAISPRFAMRTFSSTLDLPPEGGPSQLHAPYGVCHVGWGVGRPLVRRGRLHQHVRARQARQGAPDGSGRRGRAPDGRAGSPRPPLGVATWGQPAGLGPAPPACEGSDVHLCTAAVALAAADACRTVAGVEPVLKWPNDLLVGRGPSSPGCWPRRSSRAARRPRSWSGIGINVAWPGPAGCGWHLPGRPRTAAGAGRPPRSCSTGCWTRWRHAPAAARRRGGPPAAWPTRCGGAAPPWAGRCGCVLASEELPGRRPPSTTPGSWSSRRVRDRAAVTAGDVVHLRPA